MSYIRQASCKDSNHRILSNGLETRKRVFFIPIQVMPPSQRAKHAFHPPLFWQPDQSNGFIRAGHDRHDGAVRLQGEFYSTTSFGAGTNSQPMLTQAI